MDQDSNAPVGARLHFRRYGDGPALVVLHGFLGASGNWHSLSSNVFGEHFATFAVDQRNHGRSPHTEHIDYERMADDLRDFLDARDLTRAHVLGHSMGGKVAMQFALRYPERVDRLVIVDIAPEANAPRHRQILDALRAVDPGAAASRKEVDQQLARHLSSAPVRQFLLKNLAFDSSTRRYSWEMNLDVLEADYDRLNEAIWADAPFDGPTLFVRGERSDYITSGNESGILQLFPRARIESISDAGHWVHADAPEAFGKVVLDFLLSRA